MFLELLLASAVAWLIYWIFAFSHPKNFPPGPRLTLPIFGNGLQLGKNFMEGLSLINSRYGPLSGMWLGKKRAVIISDYDTLVKIGNMAEFSDRPFNVGTAETRNQGFDDMTSLYGVLFSNGKRWAEQRRFTLHTLRNLGFGKDSMESLIIEETEEFCSTVIDQSKGVAIDIRNKMNIAVLNSLWRLLSNEKLEYTDLKLQKLVYLIDRTLSESGNIINEVIFRFKITRRIAKFFNIRPGFEAFSSLRQFSVDSIDQHKQSMVENSVMNDEYYANGDFIHRYFKKQFEDERDGVNTSFVKKEGELNLINVIIDLFLAGAETTSTTLNWGLLFMVLNPEIQDTVYKELSNAVGNSFVQPNLRDKERYPYTEATIHEIQRMGNILNLSVVHSNRKAVTITGPDNKPYFFPTDTRVFMNIGAVMHDPKHFPNPHKFDPTRYLVTNDETGVSSFKPHPHVQPFGIGKRKCLGETLAKASLFIFFTAIMGRYKVVKGGDEHDVVSMEPIYGTTLSPRPFKIKFIERV